MADDDLKAILEEQLAPLGPVTVRRMFGGAGVFLDGLMFALIADGVLFLKADDGNRPAFEAEDLGPFSYLRKGGRATMMSYWQAPERLLDEPDEMRLWARAAVEASRRSSRAGPGAARKSSGPAARRRR